MYSKGEGMRESNKQNKKESEISGRQEKVGNHPQVLFEQRKCQQILVT